MARKGNRSRTASKVKKQDSKEVAEITEMLEALEEYDEQFTEWEKGFYESICSQFYDQDRTLTGPQLASLRRMHDRLCSGTKVFKKDSVKYNM